MGRGFIPQGRSARDGGAMRRARGDARNLASTKSTQTSGGSRRGYARWTEEEDRLLLSHPEWTAEEASEAMGGRHSARAVECRRSRVGRWSADVTPTCRRCDERPVWEESWRARRMGLCKGCYLDEMEHRDREARRANALRQSLHKERRGRS